MLAETLAIIDNHDFAAAFAPGSRAEADIVAELPELGAAARVNGRIDRLAVTDKEVLAIDFKSNRPAPKHASDVAPLYLAQMALYRAALEKIFPGRQVRCALIWTETPLLMPLSSALLDSALERTQKELDATGRAPGARKLVRDRDDEALVPARRPCQLEVARVSDSGGSSAERLERRRHRQHLAGSEKPGPGNVAHARKLSPQALH